MEEINRLYETNRDPDNWKTRYMVILGIAEGKFRDGVPLLRRVLFEDPNPLIRHDAAFGLAEIEDVRAQHLLIRALRDINRLVRHEAADMLGWVGNRKAINALKSLLNEQDEDSIVADTARFAIEMIEYRLLPKKELS